MAGTPERCHWRRHRSVPGAFSAERAPAGAAQHPGPTALPGADVLPLIARHPEHGAVASSDHRTGAKGLGIGPSLVSSYSCGADVAAAKRIHGAAPSPDLNGDGMPATIVGT